MEVTGHQDKHRHRENMQKEHERQPKWETGGTVGDTFRMKVEAEVRAATTASILGQQSNCQQNVSEMFVYGLIV